MLFIGFEIFAFYLIFLHDLLFGHLLLLGTLLLLNVFVNVHDFFALAQAFFGRHPVESTDHQILKAGPLFLRSQFKYSAHHHELHHG